MFESIKRLYLASKIEVAHLNIAVSKGFITEEQKVLIVASKS
jgi:hypothetical protein